MAEEEENIELGEVAEEDESDDEEEEEGEIDEELEPCSTRLPIVGDVVRQLRGVFFQCADADGINVWDLQIGEQATVVDVDDDGDFILRNPGGAVGECVLRKDFGYVVQDNGSAPAELGALGKTSMGNAVQAGASSSEAAQQSENAGISKDNDVNARKSPTEIAELAKREAAAIRMQAQIRARNDRHRCAVMKAERTVELYCVLKHVHYAKLVMLKKMESDVTMAIKEAIALQAFVNEQECRPDQIRIELSPAPCPQAASPTRKSYQASHSQPIAVAAHILLKSNRLATAVKKKLIDSKMLAASIAMAVTNVPGTREAFAVTGAVTVNDIEVHKAQPPKRNAMESKKFQIGDRVFVRNKGYTHWEPGAIVSTGPLEIKVELLEDPRQWDEVRFDEEAMALLRQERALEEKEKRGKMIDRALKLAEHGAPSYSELARLAKVREQKLKTVDEAKLEELMGASLKMKMSIVVKPITPSDEAAKMMRRTFLKFCRDRRGSGLRAWRLDIDKHGTNRVPYLDFKHAAFSMGLSLDELRLAWQSWRPSGEGATPLEFHEFDPSEWTNLNALLEILWEEFNFDIDIIWSRFDLSGDGNVDLEEFVEGAERIGFTGNAKHIFYGMDTAGKGSLWKEELNYLLILQPESHGHPEDSPLVLELKAWMTKNFDTPDHFCDKMGLRFGGESMTIHSLARKLNSLGFNGDCLHTSMSLSRCHHYVSRQDFIEVMGAKVGAVRHWSQKTYAGKCMFKPYLKDNMAGEKSMTDPTGKRPEWNSATFDPSPYNKTLGKRERHMFSYPHPRPMKDEMMEEMLAKGKLFEVGKSSNRLTMHNPGSERKMSVPRMSMLRKQWKEEKTKKKAEQKGTDGPESAEEESPERENKSADWGWTVSEGGAATPSLEGGANPNTPGDEESPQNSSPKSRKSTVSFAPNVS